MFRYFSFPLSFFAGLLAVCPLLGQTQGLDGLLEDANTAQASGHYADAAALYARATALSPAQPELWSNRGVMEYISGQTDASITSLKRALALDSHLFAPMLFLGKDYLQTGKASLALPYLDRAHSLKPNDIEVLLSLGKANTDLEQPRRAAAFYADAASAAPDNAAAWFGVGASSLLVINADGRALAATHAQSVWVRSLYADELLAQGRPVEAADTYRAAMAEATPAEKISLAQNLTWMQAHPELLQLPTDSQAALQKLVAAFGGPPAHANAPACTIAPDRLPAAAPTAALLSDAACAYRQGDYERSASAADRALRQSAESAEAHYWSVKANERMAVAALGRFEELSPRSATNYVLVGNLYRLQLNADSALSEYKKALAIDAHDPSALVGAVLACLAANKPEAAAGFDQTALADRPLDPQLNLLMAEILDMEGHEDQIETYLAKCTAASPALQPRVHYLLGRVYAQQGKTEEAIRQLELALPSDRDGSMHYQLARLYQKTGDTAQAQKLFADARTLIAKRSANASVEVREATADNR